MKYVSTAFDRRYKELIDEREGFEDDPDAYAEENVFFIPEGARWNTIASNAHTPEIGIIIDNAMRAIEEDKKIYLGHSPGSGVNEGYTHKSKEEKKRIVEIADKFCRNFVEDI